jgi:hypothetical protein
MYNHASIHDHTISSQNNGSRIPFCLFDLIENGMIWKHSLKRSEIEKHMHEIHLWKHMRLRMEFGSPPLTNLCASMVLRETQ